MSLTAMDNMIKDLIRDDFKSLLPKDNAYADDIPIGELGIDSLDFFEFIVHLDEVYGIKLHGIQLDNELTLNKLLAIIK